MCNSTIIYNKYNIFVENTQVCSMVHIKKNLYINLTIKLMIKSTFCRQDKIWNWNYSKSIDESFLCERQFIDSWQTTLLKKCSGRIKWVHQKNKFEMNRKFGWRSSNVAIYGWGNGLLSNKLMVLEGKNLNTPKW